MRDRLLTVIDEEGDEIKLPTRWEICHTCSGEGKSSAYLGAFTSDQMAEDPEFFEDYMAGHYDRSCDTCNGQRVIEVVDEARTQPALLALYHEQMEELQYARQAERMEQLMEGGWQEMGWYGE